MNDQEFLALKAQHNGQAVRARKGGVTLAVFRAITYTELEPIFNDDMNPALGQESACKKCLLWPTPKEFHDLVRKQPATLGSFYSSIRSISGEQVAVELDEGAGTATAYIETPNPNPELEPVRDTVMVCGKLSFPEYQRYSEMMKDKQHPLVAHRTACIGAATFPVTREDRAATIERLPFLAKTMSGYILLLSGADVDIEGN